MNWWYGGIAILVAFLLFIASFVAIQKDPSNRAWDHTARSLVQIAIAIITVLIAFILFAKQIEQQDVKALHQQSLAASAALRSIGASVAQYGKSVEMLGKYARKLECESLDTCKSGDRGMYDMRAGYLTYLEARTAAQVFSVGKRGVSQEILNVLKSNYAFSPDLLTYTLTIANEYEDRLREDFQGIDTLAGYYQTERSHFNEGLLTVSRQYEVFIRLAFMQTSTALHTLTLICSLDAVTNFLEGSQPQPKISERHDDCFADGERPFKDALDFERRFGEIPLKLPKAN